MRGTGRASGRARVSTTPSSLSHFRSSIRDRGALVAAFAFPVLVGCAVTALIVNVPMYDEWTWAPFVIAMHDGTLNAADLWTPQGAHRMAVPTAIALALARLDGWDIRVEAWLSLALAVGTQFLLFRITARTLGARAGWTFVVASALLFSLAQAENWTWGFQFSWFLVNFCVALAVERLTAPRSPARDLAVAAVAGVVASFSLIFGLGVWVAGLAALARHGASRRAAWVLAAGLCALVFAIGYHAPASEHGWAQSPLEAVRFFFAYLGAPLGGYLGRAPSELAGIAFITLAILWLGTNTSSFDPRPWRGFVAFALVAAVLETAGRAGNGIDAALASRYVTTSTLGWIGLTGLAAGASLGLTIRRILAAAVAVLLAVANVAGYINAYVLVGLQRSAFAAVRALPRGDDDELAEYFNDPRMLRDEAGALRRARLGPFR